MKFILKNNEIVNNCFKKISECFQSEKTYQVEIKEFHYNRTNQQNRFLWGVVYKVIADELGYTADDIHEYLADKFLSETVVVLNESVRKSKSTSKLNKKEFAEYLENVVRFAAEHGIVVPDPWVTGYLER